MKRYIKCGIWMLALMVMLCACSNTSGQKADEAYSIADLYEQTEIDNIYRLNTVDTDGYYVEAAYLRDGYILLKMQDFSEQGYEGEFGTEHLLDSGKMLLFPINKPDAAVSLAVDRFERAYTLLAGGRMMVSDWDGSYTIYDSSMKEICSEESCGSFFGDSDQGDLWFMTEDPAFALHRDGKLIQTISAEGTPFGSYVGACDGKAYFAMYDDDYNEVYVTVDPEEGSCDIGLLPSNIYESADGRFNYTSEDKWYIAGIDDPYTVTAFTKLYSNECLRGIDDKYMVGEISNYDDSTQTFHQDYHIYDMRSGGLCETKSSSEISEYEMTVHDYDQGLILFETHNKELATQGMYLWDISSMSAEEPAKAYETVNLHMDQNYVDAAVQEIYDQYGVRVYYDREHLKQYSTSYDLLECTDTELLGRALYTLKECMAEYPDDFFQEIKGETYREVVFCLCDKHEQIDEYSVESVSGEVTSIEDTLRMSLDVHYWTGLRRIFLHENTHMMGFPMGEKMFSFGSRDYVEYWFNELNSPDCPSMQSYIWEQTDENLKGIYDLDHENAWYIDWYSKCTLNEDQARIMENGIYSGSEQYYTSPHIDRKSRFLNALVREVLPCVKNSQEPVFWEQRTGIVDLYREFPDFVGQH